MHARLIMMNTEKQPKAYFTIEPESFDSASFRDPAGYIFYRDHEPHRYITAKGTDSYRELHTSGLYQVLVNKGYLIPSEEIETQQTPDGPALILKPHRIPFISYPYEWSFAQLKEAAQLTLEVEKTALKHGMQLKDASAYNIQFIGTSAVFIDTLSFERWQGNTLWPAYKQFCQHFIAPIALYSYRDIRLKSLFLSQLDGIPLELAKRLLPKRAFLSVSRFLHIWLHEYFQKRSGQLQPGNKTNSPHPTKAAFGLIENLESCIADLHPKKKRTVWQNYYQGDSYKDEAFTEKNKNVEQILAELRPKLLWDLGSNSGHFTEVASKYSHYSVAFDFDTNCLESMYTRLKKQKNRTILPLHMDLANPSPGIGWEGKERKNLFDRGKCDVALALALIHHLLVSATIPLPKLVLFFKTICNHLIIEYVPPSDPKFRLICNSNPNDFSYFTEEAFTNAFAKEFSMKARIPIKGSSRVLYHFQALEPFVNH